MVGRQYGKRKAQATPTVNQMSAQFFDATIAEHPKIPDRIETGNFRVLHDWLQANIYRHRRKLTAAETILHGRGYVNERVTGKTLTTQPLIDYIRRKYDDLYEV